MDSKKLSDAQKLFAEYILQLSSVRLNDGKQLAEAGRLLMDINPDELSGEAHYCFRFLLSQIAEAIRGRALEMAHTKAFDSSPLLEAYFELAFDLMYRYLSRSANYQLLPFLKELIYYRRSDKKLQNLMKQSLAKAGAYSDLCSRYV